MGRIRGKGKKQSIIVREYGSGEEEKLAVPAKRRGRPIKALKEEVEEEEEQVLNKDVENQAALDNEKKRKKPCLRAKENPESVKEENSMEPKSNGHDLTKSMGFRHNGSRRKNKPRRAAEVGVECT